MSNDSTKNPSTKKAKIKNNKKKSKKPKHPFFKNEKHPVFTTALPVGTDGDKTSEEL